MRTHPSSEYKYPEYDSLSNEEKDALQRRRNRDRRARMHTITSRPWKIHSERGINLRKLPAASMIPNMVHWRGWHRFIQHPTGYDPEVVQTFYANMHPPTFLHRCTVMMGRIQVRISPQDICDYYEVPHQPNLEATYGLSNNPLFETSHNGTIAAALRRNGSHFWDNENHLLLKSDLHYDLGFLMLFIKTNLKPSTYCTTVDDFVADILYSLQNDLPIDIGTIIWLEMMDTGHSLSRVLPFPCLITEMCRRAGVEVTDNLTKPPEIFGKRQYSFQETSARRREDQRHQNPHPRQGMAEFSAHTEDEFQDPDYDPETESAYQPPPPPQQPGFQQGYQQPQFQQHGFQPLPPYEQPQYQFPEDTPQYITQLFQGMQMGWTSTNERLDVVHNNMQYLNTNVQYLNQRMDWEGFPRTEQEAMGDQRRRRRRHDGASGSGSGHGDPSSSHHEQ